MKKFLSVFFVAFLVTTIAHAATYNCERQEISWASWKTSNEFLFVSESDITDNNGIAFVCGHRDIYGCDTMAQVIVGSQGGVFNDEDWTDRIKNPTVFQCSVSGGNAWSERSFSDLPQCNNTSGMRFITELNGCKIYSKDATWTSLSSGGGYASSKSGDFCCGQNSVQPPHPGAEKCEGKYDSTPVTLNFGTTYPSKLNLSQCKQLPLIANPDSNGTAFQLDCVAGPKFRCCPTKCSGNMFADTTGCQCRKPGVIINKSCTEKRKGKPVGVACCNLEDAGLARYDSAQNVCICNDVNAKFEIDTSNGTGRCVTQQIPQCDTTTGARLNQNTKECECVSPELRLNADGVSCSCADSNKVYKNGKCEYSEEYLLLIKLKEIREVRARLDGIMNGFKVSVWKDAEGNFNTARLASDSIAGVVLGTVGGVVTSVVVKKNQLKKGFEAIQCAIGGQTVADYNDEFVVGPAR